MPEINKTGEGNLSSKPIIEIENCNVVNEQNLILSNVNLTVNEGDIVYLVGRVGSGKSSIIKTIIAELPVTQGDVKVAGFSLKDIKQNRIPLLRRKIGVVFQDFQLLKENTVLENLMFVLKCTGWTDPDKMEKRCMEVLKMVQMQTKEHKMPHQLSGGEQQRVAIARALLNSPSIILADEPTGNLDAQTATGIMNILMSIHNEYRPAIVIVTHNRSIIEQYPGRVILCDKGVCRELNQKSQIDDADLSVNADMPA